MTKQNLNAIQAIIGLVLLAVGIWLETGSVGRTMFSVGAVLVVMAVLDSMRNNQ